VYRELVDVWLARQVGCGHARCDALLREAIEVRARLPEVEHSPAAVDRPAGVRMIVAGVDRRFDLVELLGCHARELDSDSYSHRFPPCGGRRDCTPSAARVAKTLL
jgi:hypothetical protein